MDYNELIESLVNVGYTGDLTLLPELTTAINHGPKSTQFRDLIIWITNELRTLGNYDEQIGKTDEINDFLLELSGFLKELQCPFARFISGPISDRFQSDEASAQLLDYLLGELMAAKMIHLLQPETSSMVIELSESTAAAALKSISIALNMGKPPDNVQAPDLFGKINERVAERITKRPGLISKPLFTPSKTLTDKQWSVIKIFQKELESEYNLRRQMLITRLDVTVQSFKWSDKIRGKEDEVAARHSQQRLLAMQSGGCATDLVALLAAREDLAIIEKTSSVKVRRNTNTNLQKHVMGRVPDRGGRAYEHAPPPPEMPSWQKRSAGGGGGDRGRGGRGGGGGGHGGSRDQRQKPHQQQQQRQQQGYPSETAGYQPSVGYQQRGGGGGGYHQGGDGQRGRGGRVQGGWSQSGSNAGNNGGNFDGGSGRGKSNYNRGGGGGGGGGRGGGRPY